jgi:hypothetical protein
MRGWLGYVLNRLRLDQRSLESRLSNPFPEIDHDHTLAAAATFGRSKGSALAAALTLLVSDAVELL